MLESQIPALPLFRKKSLVIFVHGVSGGFHLDILAQAVVLLLQGPEGSEVARFDLGQVVHDPPRPNHLALHHHLKHCHRFGNFDILVTRFFK